MSDSLEKAEGFAEDFFEKLKRLIKGDNGKKEPKATDAEREQNARLAETLKRLEAEYAASQKTAAPNFDAIYPQTTGETPKTYQPVSEEYLLEEAKEALQPVYTLKQETEAENAAYKLQKLAEKQETKETAYAESAKNLQAELQALHQKHQNNMIKQGMAHSTVRTAIQAGIDAYGDASAEKMLHAYQDAYAAIQTEVEKVQTDYALALKNYELKYALDLEKKLAALQKEEEAKKKEIEAYNKKLAEAEAAYQKERAAQIAADTEKMKRLEALQGIAASTSQAVHGKSEAEKASLNARYKEALAFYQTLDPATARELMDQNYEVLIQTLGYEGFDKMYLALFE